MNELTTDTGSECASTFPWGNELKVSSCFNEGELASSWHVETSCKITARYFIKYYALMKQ